MIHEGDFLGGIIARLRQRPTEEWQHLTLLLPGRRAARKLAEAERMEASNFLPSVISQVRAS